MPDEEDQEAGYVADYVPSGTYHDYGHVVKCQGHARFGHADGCQTSVRQDVPDDARHLQYHLRLLRRPCKDHSCEQDHGPYGHYSEKGSLHWLGVEQELGQGEAHHDKADEDEDPAALVVQRAPETVLYEGVVEAYDVGYHQVDDSHVHADLQQECDIVQLPYSVTVVGYDADEPLGVALYVQQILPVHRHLAGCEGVIADEVHTQHLSEEEEAEYEGPYAAEEENGAYGPELFALGVPYTIETQYYEGECVGRISHHESEEERKEYRHEYGRVQLVVFGCGYQFGGEFELADHVAVLHLGRRGLEAGFRFVGLVLVPAP